MSLSCMCRGRYVCNKHKRQITLTKEQLVKVNDMLLDRMSADLWTKHYAIRNNSDLLATYRPINRSFYWQ